MHKSMKKQQTCTAEETTHHDPVNISTLAKTVEEEKRYRLVDKIHTLKASPSPICLAITKSDQVLYSKSTEKHTKGMLTSL